MWIDSLKYSMTVIEQFYYFYNLNFRMSLTHLDVPLHSNMKYVIIKKQY